MHRNASRFALPIALCLLTVAAAAGDRLGFTEITAEAGIAGPSGPDAGGHGAMWADITGNGYPDLYMPFNWQRKQYPDYFYRNTNGVRFVQEAEVRGIVDIDGGSHGACWADLDNDGDYDLVNGTTLPHGRNTNRNDVYRNDGKGMFADVTPDDMTNTRGETRGITAFDMDGDGDLDVFAVNGYKGSDDSASERNELYRNEGGMRFTAVTSGDAYTCPAGQGCIDTDWDNDGDVDLIAANRTGDLNLLRNDGRGNFSLIRPSEVGLGGAQDGITSADIDNDGDLDLLLDKHLYRNDGSGKFKSIQRFRASGYMGGFADLDNDGDLDLVFPGHAAVFLNDGSGEFTAGPAVPNARHRDPRAVSFADIDNDGDVDFIYAGKREPNKLYRNNLDGGNWLKVRLISPKGQAGAFGAKVFVYAERIHGGRLLGTREAKGNYGYLAQDDPVLHFGLGGRTVVTVVVRFLDGTKKTQAAVHANRTITISGCPTTKP